MKLKNYLSSAVRNVKSFVVNKASSMAMGKIGSASSIFSSFTSNFNNIKTGDISGVNTLLKKSPFEKTLGSSSTNVKDDPLGFQHLQYPTDLTGVELGNWILFFTISTNLGKNPAFNADLELARDMGLSPGTINMKASRHQFDEEKYISSVDEMRDHYKKRLGPNFTIPRMNKTNTVLTDESNRDIVSGAIALYMPSDIKVSYGANWEAEDTSISGDIAAAWKNVKQVQIADLMQGKGQEDLFKNIVGSAAGIAGQAAARGVSAISGGFGMGDWLKLLGKGWGMAMNNRKEMFYEGPQFRTFSYSFAFWPRNDTETAEVQKIITMFKYHMHPWKDDEWGGRVFRYPSEFEIHYLTRTGINEKLHKISRCALTKCDVGYTPEGGNFKTFEDNAPVTYTINLEFKELEYLTKQKMKDNY